MVIASIYPLISSCWIVTLWSALSAETTLPLTSYRWAAFEASGDLDAGPEPQAETIRPKINKEQSRNLLFITSVFSQFSGASLVFTINARECRSVKRHSTSIGASFPPGVTRNFTPRHSISFPTRPAAQTPNAIRSRIGASQKYRASARSFKPYTPTTKRGRNRARIVTANNHSAKPEKPQAAAAASAVATP